MMLVKELNTTPHNSPGERNRREIEVITSLRSGIVLHFNNNNNNNSSQVDSYPHLPSYYWLINIKLYINISKYKNNS